MDENVVDVGVNIEAVPPALQDVDPEKLARLRDKIKAYAAKPAEERPDEGADDDGPRKGPVTDGKDVDWSEYDLPFELRHLYKTAVLRETPAGPKWVAMLDEFRSYVLNFGNHTVTFKDQYSKTRAELPKNLGQFFNDILNGPDGWKPVTVLPVGSMGDVGVLLQRQVPWALPDPVLLEKETVVAEPTEEELVTEEDEGLAFAEREGLPVPTETEDAE